MRIKGFTLIELIVVIAIIAILAAIIAPNAFKAIEKAKISGAIEDFRSIKTAAMAYYADVGGWPANCTTPTNCQTGFISTDGNATWDGPYLEKWPQSSKWGGSVTYTADSSATAIRWNASAAAGERFVNMTNVPWSAAQKMDTSLDGTVNAGDGDVRFAPNTTGVQTKFGILISRDGPSD